MLIVHFSMTSQISSSNNQKFNLEERTAAFGEAVINFCRGIKADRVSDKIVSQLVRSGTSVGANYYEANECNSKRDFSHKLVIAKKEAKETMYWLRMISRSNPEKKSEARKLWQEVREFVLIFSSAIKNSKLGK